MTATFKYVLCVLVCLAAFTIDVAIPAIPMIKEHYQVSSNFAQLIVGSYLLGFTLVQIPVGIVSDKFGRMPVLLVGLVVFVAMSFWCIYAETGQDLLLARFFQGMAGGVGPVLSRAMVRDICTGVEMAKMMAMLVSSLAIVTMLAPVFGSFLIELYGWQAPFVSSFVLGIVCLLVSYFFLTETHTRSEGRTRFTAGIKQFFSNKESLVGGQLTGFLFFGYMAFVATFTTILAEVYSIETLYLGVIVAIPITAYLFGSWVYRRVISSLGIDLLLNITAAIFSVVFIALLVVMLIGEIALSYLCLVFIPFFLAMGLLLPSSMMLAMKNMAGYPGAGSSILGTWQILGGSIGGFISAYLYSESIVSMLLVMEVSIALIIMTFLYYRWQPLSEGVRE